MSVTYSFCALCLLLALGKYLRLRIRFLQILYLPSSVVAGVVGLVIIQLSGDALPAQWTAGWNKIPGILINVVFAALFLGVAIPPIRTIWQKAGPQLAYGQIVAWGQYLVGLGAVLMLLRPLFGTNPLFGVIVPVGFEGGHGTAAGLATTFSEKLNWPEGVDFAMASATAGIVSAIVVGMILINWAARRHILENDRRVQDLTDKELQGIYPLDDRPPMGRQTVSADSVDTLALHLSIIGIAILIGIGIRTGLSAIEARIPGMQDIEIMRAFPLFPLCMLGGLLVQVLTDRYSKTPLIDHGVMQRVSGTALDFLVVAAISTIRIEVVASNWLPFVIIIIAGILWNVFCVTVLAKRLLPDAWFERAMAEMGQSMGVTATGLLLLRVVDPESKTNAPAAFGYKQLLHEPFMGGGLWTTFATIAVFQWGGWPIFFVSAGAIAVWLTVWSLVFRRAKA